MIVVQLKGGLGNQLFQYAFGRAKAERLGCPLLIDARWFKKGNRDFELRHYPIDAKPYTWWRRRSLRSYEEKHHNWDPDVADVGAGTYFSGYWQSERYFSDCADLIRRQLGRPGPIDEGTVSLHIRRGDYVHHKAAAEVHGVCLRHYYRRAVTQMQEEVPDAHFRIFSDEPEWVRENFQVDAPMEVMESGAAHEDLHQMSLCQHHITANSTFSWWGAWLSNHPEKIVMTPDTWFTDGRDVSPIFVKGWITVGCTSEESGSARPSRAARPAECGSR